jgi:hypothetical protein
MTQDDSAVRLDQWWQGLTDDQHAEFRGLKDGDPFPTEHLSAYARASLVTGTPSGGHLVNARLGGFLDLRRGEQK